MDVVGFQAIAFAAKELDISIRIRSAFREWDDVVVFKIFVRATFDAPSTITLTILHKLCSQYLRASREVHVIRLGILKKLRSRF